LTGRATAQALPGGASVAEQKLGGREDASTHMLIASRTKGVDVGKIRLRWKMGRVHRPELPGFVDGTASVGQDFVPAKNGSIEGQDGL